LLGLQFLEFLGKCLLSLLESLLLLVGLLNLSLNGSGLGLLLLFDGSGDGGDLFLDNLLLLLDLDLLFLFGLDLVDKDLNLRGELLLGGFLLNHNLLFGLNVRGDDSDLLLDLDLLVGISDGDNLGGKFLLGSGEVSDLFVGGGNLGLNFLNLVLGDRFLSLESGDLLGDLSLLKFDLLFLLLDLDGLGRGNSLGDLLLDGLGSDRLFVGVGLNNLLLGGLDDSLLLGNFLGDLLDIFFVGLDLSHNLGLLGLLLRDNLLGGLKGGGHDGDLGLNLGSLLSR